MDISTAFGRFGVNIGKATSTEAAHIGDLFGALGANISGAGCYFARPCAPKERHIRSVSVRKSDAYCGDFLFHAISFLKVENQLDCDNDVCPNYGG